MANYEQTTAAINSQIKTNGNREISGQILQNVLNAIVNNLKQGYLLVGIATPDGNPGTPDQDVCWLATKGTYVNYGNITVGNGKLAVIKYNGTWTYDTVDVQGAIKSGDGITVDQESGEVSVNVGNGLQIAGGKVAVNTGNGIKIEDGKVAVNLVAGSYINIEDGNKINCTLDANPFYVVDELPEAPPEGLNNKLWLVPVSGQTAVDLYKWNEETSQFDKVGTITLDVNTALFIKKGVVNEADGPTTLSADAAYQFGLRNTVSRHVGIDFDNGAGNNSNIMQVLSKGGNPSVDSYMRLALNNGENILTFGPDGLAVGGPSGSQRVLPTILLISNADHDFFNMPNNSNVNTFTYTGIFNLFSSIYANKYKVRIVAETATFDSEVAFIFKSSDTSYSFLYQKGKFMFSASVGSDDMVKVYPVYAYTRRILAAEYGLNSWFDARGTSVDLYNDLRSLIAGQKNVEGTLGFLCDSANTFAITGINMATSDSITTLYVSFPEANDLSQDTLIIDSTGAFSVEKWPKLRVLWADNYNLIASGMPRPDAWLVADGTDVSLYNTMAEAYKHGYQLILKEYSSGYSGKLNQYTVKNILDLGTAYQLFFESNGSQYIFTVDSSGSIDVVCNLFSASEVGIDTFYPTSNKSYTGLTSFAGHFIRVTQAGIPVFLRTKKNQFSKSEDALVPMMNVSYSSDSVTAYYLQVESSRIGRFCIYVTSNGSVTINTLGS